jgi:outer membrane protein TolC
MKIIINILLLFLSFNGFAQLTDTLTLPWLQQKARENYPVLKQKGLLQKASAVRTDIITDSWLPRFDINGQATYQSDVTELGISNPFFQPPVIDNDMEKLNLNISQVIFDGNQVRAQKEVEAASLAMDQQNVEIQLYQVRERINQLFFAVALFDENRKVLDKFMEDLNLKLKTAEAGVANGVLLESGADVLRAEIVKMEQRILELDSDRQNALDMLGLWTGLNLGSVSGLALPRADISGGPGMKNMRPEILGFELQKSKLEAGKGLAGTKNIPRLSAFGEAGYGKPGYNMFNEGFDTYYMIGARLSWSVWDWKQASKEKNILGFQQDVVGTQAETFDLNTRIAATRQLSDVQKFRDLIEKDKKIIVLREKISRSASAQMENGIITSTDYLIELNQEIQARMSMETHKLQEIKARVDYLNIQGIDIQ